jgi:N-acetylmuramoyl-L-alanine amidase CwlA
MTQIRLSQFKYVEARWFGEPFSNGNPHVIVLHTTETPEGKSGAEDNASYSSRRPDKVSAHFYVDEDSIIQAVPLDHRGFLGFTQRERYRDSRRNVRIHFANIRAMGRLGISKDNR